MFFSQIDETLGPLNFLIPNNVYKYSGSLKGYKPPPLSFHILADTCGGAPGKCTSKAGQQRSPAQGGGGGPGSISSSSRRFYEGSALEMHIYVSTYVLYYLCVSSLRARGKQREETDRTDETFEESTDRAVLDKATRNKAEGRGGGKEAGENKGLWSDG